MRQNINIQVGQIRVSKWAKPEYRTHLLSGGRNGRHTAAALGYLHTGDLLAVQEFVGHAGPRMTSKCARVVDRAKPNPALFIPVKVW